jgi:hypothetical protein
MSRAGSRGSVEAVGIDEANGSAVEGAADEPALATVAWGPQLTWVPQMGGASTWQTRHPSSFTRWNVHGWGVPE